MTLKGHVEFQAWGNIVVLVIRDDVTLYRHCTEENFRKILVISSVLTPFHLGSSGLVIQLKTHRTQLQPKVLLSVRPSMNTILNNADQ